MKINYFEIKKMPVVIIDNFFDSNEKKEIMEELIELNSIMHRDHERLTSAKDENDNPKVSSKGISLDYHFYEDRKKSKILNLNRKIFDMDLVNKLLKTHYFFEYLLITNFDSTIVHYYENKEEYKMHRDNSLFTVLYWFYTEPKRFCGGNLVIDSDEKFNIECLNNRTVIFPSVLDHQVDSVFLDAEYQNNNFGRYSIAQFITLK